MSTQTTQEAAEAGAAAAVPQLLRVATFMAALMEARPTGVVVGSAPEVAPEVVVVVVLRAGPRDIGAGAAELFIGCFARNPDVGIHSSPSDDSSRYSLMPIAAF